MSFVQSEGFMVEANKRAQAMGINIEANSVGMPS